MSKLRVPSIQHLARNFSPCPEKVKKSLVTVALSPPIASYYPMDGAIKDLLHLKLPYAQVYEGINRGVKQEGNRERCLDILPLVNEHFSTISPKYVQAVTKRYYSVSRDLQIPFSPPLIYGLSGQIILPWFSYWKTNPLRGENLSLFVTVVDEILKQDPDLEEAEIAILDFSAPNSKSKRTLQVLNGKEIPKLSADRCEEMLQVFAEGFFAAQKELEGLGDKAKKQSVDFDISHPDLFR